MKELTWEDFYDNFYDWSEKTTAGNVKNLVSIGPANQVSEIILELYDYPKASNQLLKMAVEAELPMLFTDLVEMYDYCDAELLAKAVTVCELDDRDSESLVDVLCMVEKGPLFDAIMNKAHSCGVVFRASDLADLECALDIAVSEEMMDESDSKEVVGDDLLGLLWNLENHPKKANQLFREAVERGVVFDAGELEQLPDYIDQDLLKDALHNASVEDMDADSIVTLLDDHCGDSEILQSLIQKVIKAKKRMMLSDLCWLAEICDIASFDGMFELAEIDDVEALVSILSDHYDNPKVMAVLTRRILEEKILFTVEQLEVLDDVFDSAMMAKVALQSASQFKQKDVEALAFFLPDAVIVEICKKHGLKIPKDIIAPATCQCSSATTKRQSKGFLGDLFAGLFGGKPSDVSSDNLGQYRRADKKMHCTGDCANCPPHYGYRYGRWYYGRCHQYGCEFGGNRGDGACD